MHVFVTGASGWIGSAVTAELLAAGHQVTGLARSAESAAAVSAAGASAHRGSLDDLDSLRAGARAADAVIHLGFKHDFSDMPGAWRTERAVVETFLQHPRGVGPPVPAGVRRRRASRPGRAVTERDANPSHGPDSMRGGAENLALEHADRRGALGQRALRAHRARSG